MITIFPNRDKMYGDYDKAHKWALPFGKQSNGDVKLSLYKSDLKILTTCFHHLNSFRFLADMLLLNT